MNQRKVCDLFVRVALLFTWRPALPIQSSRKPLQTNRSANWKKYKCIELNQCTRTFRSIHRFVKWWIIGKGFCCLLRKFVFKCGWNCSMLRLVEDGEMYRLRKFWNARKPECIQSAKKNIIHVGIMEFSCALGVFGFGVFVSLLVLALEVTSRYKRLRFKLKFRFRVKSRPKIVQSQNDVTTVIIPYTN